MPCRIESELVLPLFVGCTAEERAVEQPVWMGVSVEHPSHWRAAETDELAHTLDVDRLLYALAETARAARAQTLERLGLLLEQSLRRQFPEPGLGWELRIRKERKGWTYVQTWRN